MTGLRRFGPLLAVGLLLVAAAVAAMLASPQIHASRLPPPPWPDADKTPPPRPPGRPRDVGDTPTELVTRLLAGHAVSAAVLYRLAEVYRLARYATHTVDESMRDQARAALGQLRAELSAERVGA